MIFFKALIYLFKRYLETECVAHRHSSQLKSVRGAASVHPACSLRGRPPRPLLELLPSSRTPPPPPQSSSLQHQPVVSGAPEVKEHLGDFIRLS